MPERLVDVEKQGAKVLHTFPVTISAPAMARKFAMKRFFIPALLLIALPAFGDEKPARRLVHVGAPQFGTLDSSGKWNGGISVDSTPCPPDGPAIHTTLGFNNVKTPDEAMDQVSHQLDQIEQEAELLESSCKKN